MKPQHTGELVVVWSPAGGSFRLLVRLPCFRVFVPRTSAEDVLSEKILRLDAYDIKEIGGLELMSHARELYLQNVRKHAVCPACPSVICLSAALQNMIETIDNLDCLPGLKYLSLAGNRITEVRELQAVHSPRTTTNRDTSLGALGRKLEAFEATGVPGPLQQPHRGLRHRFACFHSTCPYSWFTLAPPMRSLPPDRR